jgi:hypothetical protein
MIYIMLFSHIFYSFPYHKRDENFILRFHIILEPKKEKLSFIIYLYGFLFQRPSKDACSAHNVKLYVPFKVEMPSLWACALSCHQFGFYIIELYVLWFPKRLDGVVYVSFMLQLDMSILVDVFGNTCWKFNDFFLILKITNILSPFW